MSNAKTAPAPSVISTAAWVAFGLAVLGLAVSGYLTYEHFTDSKTLACSGNGAIDCLKVTTSRWSKIAGVPVALGGLLYYVAMVVLCAPLRRIQRLGVDLGLIRVIAAGIGVVMILWLIYVELFKVEAICLWCTGVHVITLLLLGAVIWWREADRLSRPVLGPQIRARR
jgi:uncharacterized membrane protein